MPTRKNNRPDDSDTNDVFHGQPETVNLIGIGIRGKVFMRSFFQQKDNPPLICIGVDAHAPGRYEVPRDEDHYNRLSAIPDYLRRQLLHAYGWSMRGAAALFIAQDENPAPAELEEVEALTVLAQDHSIPVFRVALREAGGGMLPQPKAAKAMQRLSDATLVMPHDWEGSAEFLGLRWLYAALLNLAQQGRMVWQAWDMFDVQEVLCMPGMVLYAMTAEAAGADRAQQATEKAVEALSDLGVDLEDASGVVVVLAAGKDLYRLRELSEAMAVIRKGVGIDVFILPLTPELGYDSPEDVLTVTVVVSIRTA